MRLQNKFDLFGDDTGVSPVVGVILMVAITVILAAVIANFVLGLGGQVQQNAQAGVTFDENVGNSLEVQLNSVQSADHIYVTSSNGITSDVGGVSYSGSDNPAGSNDYSRFLLSGSNGGAGTTVTLTTSNGGYDTGDTASVIGVLEGSENVIQTFDMGS